MQIKLNFMWKILYKDLFWNKDKSNCFFPFAIPDLPVDKSDAEPKSPGHKFM